MRRYLDPVASVDEFAGTRSVKRVRLLGEELILFRDRQGRFGLVDEFCPIDVRRLGAVFRLRMVSAARITAGASAHRGIVLSSRMKPDGRASRSAWKRRRAQWRNWAGCYLPIWDRSRARSCYCYYGLFASPAIRMIGQSAIPANWRQLMENSVDQEHTEWLHGKLHEHVREQQGQPVKVSISRKNLPISFSEFEHGIIKRRLLEGRSEDCGDWKIGQPLVFPTMLAVGHASPQWTMYAFQIRTPIHDTRTLHWRYTAHVPREDAEIAPHLLERMPVYDVSFLDSNGEYVLDMVDGQDIMPRITQGPQRRPHRGRPRQDEPRAGHPAKQAAPRDQESAKGRGPLGTVGHEERNSSIDLPLTGDKRHFTDGFASLLTKIQPGHSPIARELIELFSPKQATAFEEMLRTQ